ncbi:hypothetical protein SAY87_009605 [Trapa incisa]|uniref:Uncharacterized protein n=1 Tax=Trapa incisa TaxID=236973 RepID=A0AAN7JVX4_9MYRT|nr:hypothetical protein SAY87_009605 [Trapa incisa]
MQVMVSAEDFDRITSENRLLTELVFTMFGDMRTRLADMQSPANAPTDTRKRKLEDYEWNDVIRIWESSSSNNEEIHQTLQDNGRMKVSRVYIRVDPSDISLGHRKLVFPIPDLRTMMPRSPSTPSTVVQPRGLPTPAAQDSSQETAIPKASDSTGNVGGLLVQQMASSLTSDPSFTQALASAISERILHQELPESWP